jgi:hypothetical protein
MGTNPLEEEPMYASSLRKAATALLLVATTPAAADTGRAWIGWSKDNPLVVLSNGQNYTKVQVVIGDFVLRGRLEFETGTAGTVKSWTVWPDMSTGYGIYQEIAGLKDYKVSKSYSIGSRPGVIDKQIEFSIPYSVVQGLAISMCEQKAHSLREQGKSDKQIFGQNHEVSYRIGMNASVDSTGAGSGNQIWEGSEAFVLPVRCAKWAGAQVEPGGNGNLADSFRVLSATLKLQEQTAANGLCRVKTATAIRGNKAGETFSYRFVHSSGKKSAVYKIKTEANKIAVINRTWDIPNEDGPETGWLRVEGVGTAFKTANVGYSMQCPDKAPGGLVLGN